MMRLPPFQYLAPRTVEEAVEMVSRRGPEAMVVAGGTDLYPNMKRRQFEPRYLVGLRGIGDLRGISGSAREGVTLKAGATLTEVTLHREIRQHYPALAHAAGQVGTPQLRNMGTIGGNLCLDTRCNYYNQSYFWRRAIDFCMKKDGDTCLVAPGSPRCWAVSSSDTAPVMVALDAKVKLVGPKGERWISAEALFNDDGINYLTKGPDEILTEVTLPPVDGIRSTYWKLRRRGSFDFPVLGVAIALKLDMNRTIREARIALGAVGSRPIRPEKAEAALMGQRLTAELADHVGQLAAGPVKPLDNTDLAYFWRKRMVKVYVARSLL